MELPLFEQVADVVGALIPEELGPAHHRSHRHGIKVWFGPAEGNREHYEAQIIARRHVDGVDGRALEVGFHAEHPDGSASQATIDRLGAAERTWRKALGPDAVAGAFLGDALDWRRLSEVWMEPDTDDPEVAFEIASRLTDYITTLQPLLTDPS